MGLLGSIGKFLTGGKKKSSKSKSQGTSDYDPYEPTIPYVSDVLARSKGLISGPQFSQDELAGYQLLRDTINQPGRGAIEPAIAENNKTLSGYYLDPNTNPYIKEIADRMGGVAATTSNASFRGAGRTGSGLGGYYAGKGAAEAAGDVYYQNYGDERARMGSAVGMAPSLEQGRFLAPQALISAGQIQSARPFDLNAQYADIIGNMGRLGQQGKTTGETTNYGYQQGLLGKIATSFTNKLFGLG